jgi:TrmH family RNA methyltransferase
MFLIEGVHLLYEAIKSGAEIKSVFVRAGDEDKAEIRDLLLAMESSRGWRLREVPPNSLCGGIEFEGRLLLDGRERAVDAQGHEGRVDSRSAVAGRAPVICLLDRRIFDSIADTVSPQGVMAVLAAPAAPARGFSSAVVLDRLQDPGNVGSIIRSADAAGVEAVVCVRGTADIYSRKVVRAAAGALFRSRVYFVRDAEAALELLRGCGVRAVACDMEAGTPYHAASLSGRTAIIIGNEGGGLSEAFLRAADETVHIPMEKDSESLNASVAAAVIMFEKRRQDGLMKQCADEIIK